MIQNGSEQNKMLLKQVLILFSSSILLACASGSDVDDTGSDGDEGRRADCIFGPSIRGYQVLDDSNLIVEGSGRRNYHVVLYRQAFGLSSSWALEFESPTGRICGGFSEVTYDGTLQRESIRIRSIRELTDEDREDLLIQFGKKKPEIEQTPAQREVGGAEVEELDPAANGD